jgi:hypothetical protein
MAYAKASSGYGLSGFINQDCERAMNVLVRHIPLRRLPSFAGWRFHA